MKQITAIVQPHRVDAIEAALHQLPHLPGFTLLPAHGHARGHGQGHHFADDEWNPDAHPRVVLLMYCADAQVDSAVDAIRQAARTGLPGDGLIAITEVVDLLRIRNDERGDAAV